MRDGFGAVRVLGQPDWGSGSGYGERERELERERNIGGDRD